MKERISKSTWVGLGGLKNSDLFRVQRKGRWFYYRGAKS